MARPLSKIREEIQALNDTDKNQLLRDLIAGLDTSTDGDVQRAWFSEASRRLQEVKDGTVESIPAEEAFERARAAISE